ncbi:leucyl aminopeptidase [Thioclava sp. SK-1]|uniref:leucyl aminopeptidase n=1 Tax=Thioclava sp. SK-1 TaxID=1889770 RepID=UPI0008250E17|nr:leucyl aminopeptidase [Thioclava sp. SK-1]OCX66135.1 leucyl aminopeptidase [Thioclava sp. SK-1]
MPHPVEIHFRDTDLEALASHRGNIALILDPSKGLGETGRRLNKLTKGAIKRAVDSEGFAALSAGEMVPISWPAGLETELVQLVALPKRATAIEARKAGAAIAKRLGAKGALVLADAHDKAADISFGLALRAYRFDYHTAEKPAFGAVDFMVAAPEEVAAAAAPYAALTEGVFFTRDLTGEPANILTTDDFAARLAAMQELGLEVDILEEDELETLGMRALLGVGQGSESPSKVVVMKWMGGGDEPPLALVGKGVVFDTGGISLKPSGGMEDMTMDMGGAGVVAGVMRALALRKASANVVGLVGLVENMPDGRAQRPGDIVTSMKGDTIEIINTDAEGRLVLADVLWYTQETFKPSAVIDLATLTGAVIVALGHENAGLFTNDDALVGDILKAAKAEGEGAWHLPLDPAYDALIKSAKADVKNSGGRHAGAITAAAFLKRFIKPEIPWCHIDIAGVAQRSETALAPKGATGWGVVTLDRLIRDRFEV